MSVNMTSVVPIVLKHYGTKHMGSIGVSLSTHSKATCALSLLSTTGSAARHFGRNHVWGLNAGYIYMLLYVFVLLNVGGTDLVDCSVIDS